MDSQHEEHEIVEEIGPDDDDKLVPQNIIILTDDEIKKLNPNAKWRLLKTSTDEVKEPECIDPTLVAPSEARYKRNNIDVNAQNDKENVFQ